MVTPPSTRDVLIVGGGPAGLAAAIALRRRGIQVTVADSMLPPIDKACGEGLLPDSLHDLALLGVELPSNDGAELHGIRFVNHSPTGSPSQPATAQFPSGHGFGLRRQTLHQRLVDCAEAAGVALRWQSPVELRQDGQVLLAGRPVRYGWLIGADGQNSRVRRWAGLEPGAVLSRRFGFRLHFPVAPWSPYVEVHWGASGQAYVTPVGPREVCIATLARDPNRRLSAILSEMPVLRDKLGSHPALDHERGALTTTRRLASVARGRVALIGDASGSADAITGEGLGLAFRQALLLAECLASSGEASFPARYNGFHAATLRLPQTMARVLLLMDRSPILRTRALRLLAAQPDLFARLVGVHVAAEPLHCFLAAKGFSLAWGLAFQSGATKSSLSAENTATGHFSCLDHSGNPASSRFIP